jgi:hypothetical protein
MGAIRVLEYLSREDADRAVKELDGRDLRGRPVRVALDDSASCDQCLYLRTFAHTEASSVVDLTITGGMIVVMIVLVMIVTGTIVITGTSGRLTDVTGLGHLPVVPNTMIVAPGLRPPGGRLMIEGLQGTNMTGEEVSMTADSLIIMMIDAGTMWTDAGTTEGATRRRIHMRKGPADMPMEMVVGPVEQQKQVARRWVPPPQVMDGENLRRIGFLSHLWSFLPPRSSPNVALSCMGRFSVLSMMADSPWFAKGPSSQAGISIRSYRLSLADHGIQRISGGKYQRSKFHGSQCPRSHTKV